MVYAKIFQRCKGQTPSNHSSTYVLFALNYRKKMFSFSLMVCILQSQKAVSAYFTSKQILPFGFA